MRRFLLVIWILLLSAVTFGQDCPKTTYRRNRLVRVMGFNADSKKDFTCRIVPLTGVIQGLDYTDDVSTEPIAVILRFSDGTRERIALAEDLDCFSEAAKAQFYARLKRNMRVRIGAFACGASGRGDKQIFSIDFL